MKIVNYASLVIIASTLSACGSSDEDKTPPEISLIGSNPIEIAAGSAYTELGANAIDNVDGDVDVTITGTVNTSRLGSYTVTYLAQDQAGNSTKDTRTVHVVDKTPPTISLLGDNPVQIAIGATYAEAGATATDNIDGEVRVTISGNVDTTQLGTYTLTYTAIDDAGNESNTRRLVNVVDITPPVITLLGNNPMAQMFGAAYSEAGASAVDNVDGTVNVVISGTVNTNRLGAYTMTYHAQDEASNESTATRIVNVVDMTPPVINLLGDDSTQVVIGNEFTDQGAEATDDVDGTVDIAISGTVDINTLGTYTLTYTAEDEAGNSAQTTRTVDVISEETELLEDSIQVFIETSATIDINLIEQSLEASEEELDLDVRIEDGKAIWRRTYRELMPKADSCGAGGSSYLDDVVSDLVVEFSVSEEGILAANTISENASSHLTVLSTAPGWSSADFEINYTDFSGSRLPWGSFGDPASGYTSELKHSNHLSKWLQGIYNSLHNSGIVLGGPSDNAEFFELPHSLANGFEEPITMVRSYLRNQQMDYSWYNEEVRAYDQFYNEQWSPVANAPDQRISLARNFDLSYRDVSSGLMTIHTLTDNSNSGEVTAEGMTGITPFSSSGNVTSSRRWSASCTSSSCTVSNNSCTGALLQVADAYPLSVSMEGYSTWSWTGMAAEVAVFGDVTSSNHSESPSPGDDENPAPLRFVIPAAE